MNHSQAFQGARLLYESNPLNFNRYYLRKILTRFYLYVLIPGLDTVFTFSIHFDSALGAALYAYNVEFNNEPYSLQRIQLRRSEIPEDWCEITPKRNQLNFDV